MELKRIEAARNIAKIIGSGNNRVFLDSDTLMMNLTQGFTSNLEKKTKEDYDFERQVAMQKALEAEEKLKKLKK
jgi:hypothetical protein